VEKLSELIGNRIREIRKQKGLRQEDMENHGINYRYFQKIESGTANITLNTIEKIAKALDIDPTELFIMPLKQSPISNEVASQVIEIIKQNDHKTLKKLNIFLREILD